MHHYAALFMAFFSMSELLELPEKWVHRSKAYGDYFEYYLSQDTIDRQVAQETNWNALFAGRYDFLARMDRGNMWPLYRECPAIDALPIANPFEQILSEAAPFRVLAFNEDHQELRQRYFLLENLETFWKAGYRHLGYEAFFLEDTRDGGDLSGSLGYYFNDPVMAATLRKAHAFGFEIFGYESKRPRQAEMDWAEAQNTREAGQAERVARYLERIPDGEKVLLWAGGHHISKRTDQTLEGRSIVWMAARLKRDHKIEAYSVDLTNCQYQAVSEQAVAKAYQNADGIWAVSDLFAEWGVDAQLHLPVVTENGFTPGQYRKHIGDKFTVPSELRELADTVFIQAFQPDQEETATAYDSILMFNGEILPLYLPKGTFKLVAYASDGARLGDTLITVE